MNISNLVQAVAAAIIFFAALAAVIAYLRTNISKNTVDLYRQDNDALRARIHTLDDEVVEKDKVIATQQGKITQLEVTRRDLIARTDVSPLIEAVARIEKKLNGT